MHQLAVLIQRISMSAIYRNHSMLILSIPNILLSAERMWNSEIIKIWLVTSVDTYFR